MKLKIRDVFKKKNRTLNYDNDKNSKKYHVFQKYYSAIMTSTTTVYESL